MRRLTTPTHKFELGFDTELIRSIRITYAQGGRNILKKEKSDCVFEGENVLLRLTQDETRRFSSSGGVKIQIRIITKDGEALASDIFEEPVDDVLDNEVMT